MLTTLERVAHQVNGLAASPGIGVGEVVVCRPHAELNKVPDKPTRDPLKEYKRFTRAIASVKKDIRQMKVYLADSLVSEELSLFDAYLHILDSHSIADEVKQRIFKGQWAEGALRDVVKHHVAVFEKMKDPYLSARSEDVKDLGQRILAYLQERQPQVRSYPHSVILVGEALTATILLGIPAAQIAGVVSTEGTANSHLAILTRAMGIPFVTNLPSIEFSEWEGQSAIVDGHQGQIILNASDAILKYYQQLAKEDQELAKRFSYLQAEPSVTLDGFHIPLLANVGSLSSDIHVALETGAAGVGLYRSEMIFMSRDSFPSEEEQVTIYQRLLQAFPKQPVTIRTLDIGGDKHLPYFPIHEANPFLGWRGVRVTLDNPDLFLMQLRALLKANIKTNNLQILLPMVSQLQEVDDTQKLLSDVMDELKKEGHAIQRPPLGVMVEVPAMLYQLERYAHKVDFFSVGSNDLIQYLFAVDRGNARVVNYFDAFDPVVLLVLNQISETVHRCGKTVSLCGEMASDPMAAILLMAMGYDTLSVSPDNLLRIKWAIRNFSREYAREILDQALLATTAQEVRVLVKRAMEKQGVVGIVRM